MRLLHQWAVDIANVEILHPIENIPLLEWPIVLTFLIWDILRLIIQETPIIITNSFTRVHHKVIRLISIHATRPQSIDARRRPVHEIYFLSIVLSLAYEICTLPIVHVVTVINDLKIEILCVHLFVYWLLLWYTDLSILLKLLYYYLSVLDFLIIKFYDELFLFFCLSNHFYSFKFEDVLKMGKKKRMKKNHKIMRKNLSVRFEQSFIRNLFYHEYFFLQMLKDQRICESFIFDDDDEE